MKVYRWTIRTGNTFLDFTKKFVKTEDTELYTDQYSGYNEIGVAVKKHETINCSARWEKGAVHTNTIEGFWSLSNLLGMDHIITTQQDTRPCIS